MKKVWTQNTVYQNSCQGVKHSIKRECSFIQWYFYFPSSSIKFHSNLYFSKPAGTYSSVSSAEYPSFSFSRPVDCSLSLLGFDSDWMKGNLTQTLRRTNSYKHLVHVKPLHYLKAIGSDHFLIGENEPLLKLKVLKWTYPEVTIPNPVVPL